MCSHHFPKSLSPHPYADRPNQPFDVVLDHVVERLSGCDTPRLHLVAFNNTEKETVVSTNIVSFIGHVDWE